MDKKIAWMKSVIHGEQEDKPEGQLVSAFLFQGMFLIFVPFYLAYAIAGIFVIKWGVFGILENIGYGDSSLMNEGVWIVYGLLLGMILSMIVQSVGDKNTDLYDIWDSLWYHFGVFIIFLVAVIFWIAVIFWFTSIF